MKGNSSSSSHNNSSRKSSFSNFVLLSLIAVLSILIIFLAYSLYVKISRITEHKNQMEPQTASAIIHIEVLNGCGVDGVAAQFTNYLRKNNFDVVNVANYRSNNIEQTMIIDRTGNRVNAEKLAESLGVEKKNIIQQLSKDYLLDATLVIGRDYYKFIPQN